MLAFEEYGKFMDLGHVLLSFVGFFIGYSRTVIFSYWNSNVMYTSEAESGISIIP